MPWHYGRAWVGCAGVNRVGDDLVVGRGVRGWVWEKWDGYTEGRWSEECKANVGQIFNGVGGIVGLLGRGRSQSPACMMYDVPLAQLENPDVLLLARRLQSHNGKSFDK
jgi:hypothetical protein